MMVDEWPFEDDPGVLAVTTKQVTGGTHPILYASRELDEDGEVTWQFLCLTVAFDMVDAQLVRLDTLLRLDPTLGELADLPVGSSATRDRAGASWVRQVASGE
jgi:hypothetical protein